MDNNDKKYMLNIYNTCTGCYEDVEVSEEVYIAFKRSYWKEKNDNRRFYKYTYPISALEGADTQEDRFDELSAQDCPVEIQIESRDEQERYLSILSETMRRRLLLYYSYGYSIKQIAEMEKVSFDTCRESIKRGKEKIKKFFEGDPQF